MSKVSVIIPVYNSEKYLNKCLDSLKKQNYSDFEVVAVNDGSVDKSRQILDEYIYSSNLNIKVIDQKNSGVAIARQTGLDNSDSKYVVFLDSDDYIDNDYLQKLVRTIEETKTNICCSRMAIHFDSFMLRNIPLKSRKMKVQKINLSENKEYLPLINVVSHSKIFDRDYAVITDKKYNANEDLSINFYNYVQAKDISFSDTSYHYVPNELGLVSKNLSGYSYESLMNVINPLEDLKLRFQNNNILTFYNDEIECIYLINLFQKIVSIYCNEKDKYKKYNLIKCIVEFIEINFPNWKENKYFLNNFKGFELPYIKDCLLSKFIVKNIVTDDNQGKNEIIEKYKKLSI